MTGAFCSTVPLNSPPCGHTDGGEQVSDHCGAGLVGEGEWRREARASGGELCVDNTCGQGGGGGGFYSNQEEGGGVQKQRMGQEEEEEEERDSDHAGAGGGGEEFIWNLEFARPFLINSSSSSFSSSS